jgi:hypothetical protein
LPIDKIIKNINGLKIRYFTLPFSVFTFMTIKNAKEINSLPMLPKPPLSDSFQGQIHGLATGTASGDNCAGSCALTAATCTASPAALCAATTFEAPAGGCENRNTCG